MTIEQVYNYFKDKEDLPCPLTERLVGAGYQQKDGGYIKRAKKEGLEIDFTKNCPSQYWHLMTFCSIDDVLFHRSDDYEVHQNYPVRRADLLDG